MPTNTEQAVRALDVDGFYVFKNFFPVETAESARREILEWIEADLAERTAEGIAEPLYKGVAGTTILTPPTHLVLDAYAKSATLDLMVEKVLTDPVSREVLGALAGEQIKFRGYNVQRLTGNPDHRPAIGVAANPHEWHRDSLGEFGIGIFLEDVPGPDNGATSLVPGSHRYAYCPRWNCLFGPPYKLQRGGLGIAAFLRINFFNRLLGRRIDAASTGAYGNQGDFYFFINDVWHGREPNIHGRTGIKIMIGAFASDDPFPDQVTVPPEAVLDRLPPRVRAAAAQTPAAGASSTASTLIKRLRAQRNSAKVPFLFRMAQCERRMADAVSAFARALRGGVKFRG